MNRFAHLLFFLAPIYIATACSGDYEGMASNQEEREVTTQNELGDVRKDIVERKVSEQIDFINSYLRDIDSLDLLEKNERQLENLRRDLERIKLNLSEMRGNLENNLDSNWSELNTQVELTKEEIAQIEKEIREWSE